MKALWTFWLKYVGRFEMFSFVLLALEEMLGDNFVCPCKQEIYNQVISILYGVVPAFGCLVCTLVFVDLGKNTEVANSSGCNGKRIFYSLLSVFTWVSLYFLDGRYLACAYSNWEGLYIKSDTLGTGNWCKPIGNETSELGSQLWILKLTFISQVTGFVLMTGVIIALGIFRCCCPANTEEVGQHAEEGMPMNPMRSPHR